MIVCIGDGVGRGGGGGGEEAGNCEQITSF